MEKPKKQYEVKMLTIDSIQPNPENPRIIKDGKFKKLVKSLHEFPEMMQLRPVVCNNDMMILGGNMRWRAAQAAGWKTIPVIIAENLTAEQQREFIIKDNVSGGEWDWDIIANEWDPIQIEDWGLDVPRKIVLNEDDLFEIQLPFYTPSENEPIVGELANIDKAVALIKKIDSLKVSDELKEVLKLRAAFFTDFNFQKIADYYARQDKKVQEVFCELGMVILAPKEALKKGFVQLTEYLLEE
jgi:hypothetical protein